jgi:hypothetical protein
MRNSSVLIFLLISVLAFPLIQVNADQPSQNTQSGNTIFSWSGTALSVEIEGEWNWSDTISLSEDNGIWSTEIELSEGLYCYKLIVDGVYIFDPSNPYRGYCGEYENSVVRVEDASRPNFESHIVDDILTVTFIPGIGGAGPEQIPNDLNGATWDVNNMQWTLDLSSFTEGKHTLTSRSQ